MVKVAGRCTSINMTLMLWEALGKTIDHRAELTIIDIGNTQHSFKEGKQQLF